MLEAEINGRMYSALLDSGAQGNFISPRIINKDEIPWHQKEDPYRLSTVEGTEVGYGNGVIDMETDHLPVSIQGHETSMTLDITDTAQHELILGLPWLRATNPRIDWTTGQIFWDNAVPQEKVAIKDEGRSSVTEDSKEMRSNEPTNTSGSSQEETQLWKNREGSDQSWTPEEGRSRSEHQRNSGPPRTDKSTTHKQETERYLLYLHQRREQSAPARLERIPRDYHEFRKVFQEELDTGMLDNGLLDQRCMINATIPHVDVLGIPGFRMNEQVDAIMSIAGPFLRNGLEQQNVVPSLRSITSIAIECSAKVMTSCLPFSFSSYECRVMFNHNGHAVLNGITFGLAPQQNYIRVALVVTPSTTREFEGAGIPTYLLLIYRLR
jgi:hypothetical protein